MSEFKKTRDVSTYQKLPPPKSLQGEEDAEVTWDLILQRYPNAAPLLCQMENVIEKAEDLLQQLRAPYTHALERSSSFQIADSEDEMGPCHVEESTEVSMISEQDSRLGSSENVTPEIISVAACSLSDKISNDYQEERSVSEQVCSMDDRSSEMLKTDASVGEEVDSLNIGSSSICVSNSKNLSANELDIGKNFGQKKNLKSSLSFTVNVTESATPSGKPVEEQEVGRSSSLEAWGKVVGENATQKRHAKPFESKENSPKVKNNQEDSVSEHARRLTAFKTGPIQQITKLNLLGKKEELVQRFAGTIATASNVLDTTRMVENMEGVQDVVANVEPVIVLDDVDVPRDSRYVESPDKKINERGERNINRNVEEFKEKSDASLETVKQEDQAKVEYKQVQGNGDETAAGVGPRSPVEILEEYSKICEIPVEYQNLNSSCSYNKDVIVKCCFGGFTFEACAQAKKLAKKDSAAKLLRCLAGRQIDGENITDLKPFTRKQIVEIISLGNGGAHETAVRKLYKMCLELNAPEPIYTVHQDSRILGNRYTVKCGALGITTSGCGIRVFVAKKMAADKLLQNYHEKKKCS